MTPDEPSDAAVAAALAADLDRGFADLVRTHQSRVLGVALRVCGDRTAAEDLAAETFLRAFRSLRDHHRDPAWLAALAVRGWLVTILLNVHRNEFRTASRRPASADGAVPDRPSPAPGPEDHALRADPALAAALAALPRVQREAVVLRHVADLAGPDVAAALGVGEATARSHVSRGLARLRALLTPPDHGPAEPDPPDHDPPDHDPPDHDPRDHAPHPDARSLS